MQPEEVLRRYWGHSSFRSVQKAVIQSVIKGHDNLLIMATGAGKSLCYQIPPLLTRRPCIIISPLISLMEDQVNALNARLAGHATACFLGSAQTSSQVKRDAWDGKHLFVYMTPELALNSTSEIKSLDSKIEGGLSFIAVDEAHCVSEWGHDFRRDYLRLGELRSVVNCPVLALTATATSQVQLEIAAKLCMRPDARRWVTSFERPNLFFKVVKRTGPDQLIARLMENFKISASEPSIVYCNTVIQVEEISKMLNQEGRFLGRVSSYHGSMGLGERSSSHKRFLNDDSDIMVATLAYGMGIDKKNVRHIYHFGCPASLEAYYQQAGRAGRDNEHATCTLLWTAGDLMTIDRIKDPGLLSEAGRRAHEAGINAIQGFLSSTR
jgi:ATP-dependent DNA helicase RecQ